VYYCPKCGAKTFIAERVFTESKHHSRDIEPIKDFELIPVLDNIRSAYNVGSIIRTCEGLGIGQIVLCGITPTPLSGKVKKTALGASSSIKWEHQNNCVKYIIKMKSRGYSLLALENMCDSINILNFRKSQVQGKIILVIGNEKSGVDPAILRISDFTVSIPMAGKKESLNVSVAAGIAVFHLFNLFKT